MRLPLSIVTAWLMSVLAAHAGEETVRLAGLSVEVWSHPAGANVPQPTLLFSHGFHGCSTQSRFLMEAFAEAGYLVLAPNHRDATCHGGEAGWAERPELPFQQPQRWDDTSYRDRAEDLRRLIEAARTDPRFRARVDWSRLGLVGHSLGGYTVLGLAGAWPSWRLPGIKAVLALSPYAQPFARHRTLAGLTAPVMYQGGTRDFGITPALRRSEGSYDSSPPPKYYVEFDRAGHLAWTNLRAVAHDSIVAYSLAFVDHYLKGEAASAVLTRKLPGVAVHRYASELGSSDPDAGGGSPPHAPARPLSER